MKLIQVMNICDKVRLVLKIFVLLCIYFQCRCMPYRINIIYSSQYEYFGQRIFLSRLGASLKLISLVNDAVFMWQSSEIQLKPDGR